jgi:tetrahydrodipicolinate N-succinyltransferase
VRLGEGCHVGPNAVIGAGVSLGAGCSIGANVTISHTLAGDRVRFEEEGARRTGGRNQRVFTLCVRTAFLPFNTGDLESLTVEFDFFTARASILPA